MTQLRDQNEESRRKRALAHGTGRIVERADAQQERELRRLEGRSTSSTLRQITTDLLRKRCDQRRGTRRLVSFDASNYAGRSHESTLAAAPVPMRAEVSADPWDRAFRLLGGVPEPTRSALRRVLSILRAPGAARRVQIWREQNPGRRAFHDEIALEIGVARETVTRALSMMRQREKEKSCES